MTSGGRGLPLRSARAGQRKERLCRIARDLAVHGHRIGWNQGEGLLDRRKCPGVSGNCDLNVSYKDYPAIIRAAGLNRLDGTPDAGETITASRAEWETLKAKADKLDRIAAIVGI